MCQGGGGAWLLAKLNWSQFLRVGANFFLLFSFSYNYLLWCILFLFALRYFVNYAPLFNTCSVYVNSVMVCYLWRSCMQLLNYSSAEIETKYISFLSVDKGRLFFTKLSFEARNSKFTKFSSSERFCFEAQPSSEVYRILVDLVTIFFMNRK